MEDDRFLTLPPKRSKILLISFSRKGGCHLKFRNPKWNTAATRIRWIVRQIFDDNITLYAAQASYFVIISVVPFLSLLISIVSFFIPADLQSIFDGYALPEELTEVLGDLLFDLRSAPKVSLLSFSAITTLWIASRGASAIQAGLETVYCVKSQKGFFFEQLRSLGGTLLFIALILAMVIGMLFGEFICDLLHIGKLTDIIMRWRTPFLMLCMCLGFTAMYASTVRRGSGLRRHPLFHLPGAVFASIGWTLFSYFYSLYIRYFPNASYIYGGLTALCLIMLWLYICMVILLLGAEVNKLYFAWHRRRSPAAK